MDYFNNVLATFLSLDCVRILAVYGGSMEKYFDCALKMNDGLTGLERHG